MQNVVIFGASGHGSVVLDCIEKEAKYKVVGFIDSFEEKGTKVNGYTILGSEYDLPFLIEKYQLLGGIIAIGDNWTRSLVVERILKIAPKFNYISAVHPNAQLGKDVQIGMGSVVMPGVTINANAVIGNHCILNTNSSLDHDGYMSNFSSLAPNVCVGANFILGKGSAICLGANIIENITIGPHAVVGAGSLVVGNVTDHVLVYGAPAKVIKKRIASEPYLSGKKTSSPVTLLAKKI
ncbi:MAG: acetyltransferase [Maribacter sp.]